MKLQVLGIRFLLETLLFIDFLYDLPQKTLYYFTKTALVIIVTLAFVAFVRFELQTRSINTILAQVFIPEPHLTFKPVRVYPLLVEELELPTVTARSVVVADILNHEVLYENNANSALPPASVTKLMTALVALDIYKLNEKLLVPEICSGLPETQQIGFLPGEEVTVKDLIFSLLISSAGDSACTLAHGKVPYEEFVFLMNDKAHAIGMIATNFSNPVGFDAGDEHVSSANDILILAKVALDNRLIKDIVKTTEYTLTSGFIDRKIFNTNDLLWDVPGTVGIKTGRTYEAGEVLAYEYKVDDTDLVIVVMGSTDRFGDTKKILEWALASYDFGSATGLPFMY